VVLANRAVGAYRQLVLAAPAGGPPARPGQFVAVAVGADPGEATATLLRRAFSLHRASGAGPDGPILEVVVAAHGPGSTWGRSGARSRRLRRAPRPCSSAAGTAARRWGGGRGS